MANIVDAARLLWLTGLSSHRSRPEVGIQEWLRSANFAPLPTGNALEMSGIDRHSALSAVGFDINRSCSAGSETLRNIVSVASLPKSSAWHFVKLYYASLFYAHALLRIWGRSPSYLLTSDLLHIRSVCAAYGVQSPVKLQRGPFIIDLASADPSVLIAGDGGSGGTHEGVWRQFHQALQKLQSEVSNSSYLSSDKQSIDALLTAAIDVLFQGGGNSSWPSGMRNDIQYRQGGGLWYPYTGKFKSAALQTVAEELLLPKASCPALVDSSEVAKFQSGCAFVIWLGRAVLADLKKVSGAKSFLGYGQDKFELSVNLAA